MLKFTVSVLIVKALLDITAGHSCNDGRRVKCIGVKSTNGAPSTMGESYDAQGYPMCSLEGKKLFCLYDHDYHHCEEGFAPCCDDGSNPSHGGSHNGNDHNLDCSAAEASATSSSQTANVMASSGQTATADDSNSPPIDPIVLDNMDSTVVAESKNAFEGSYAPCMVDAYKGQFHHDWANNKGSASFTFKFMPPADGCYAVEEYHPGKTWECSRYLPNNAQLNIEYCMGKSIKLSIDQTKNAAQWNEIAQLPFYKGTEGRLTMSSSPDEVCEDDCFWVVDAFRLTWKGPSCQSISRPSSTDDEAVEDMNAGNNVVTPAGEEGVLSLSLSLADGQTMENVRLELQKGKSTLEATMATHLGYKSVSIRAFQVSGRRLMETQELKIRYTAEEKIREPNQASLKQALQSDLATMAPGLTITDMNVELPNAQPAKTETVDGGSDCNYMLYLGIAGASMVVIFVFSLLVWAVKKRAVSRAVKEQTVQAKVIEVEAAQEEEPVKEINDLEKALDKNEKVEMCDTASTGTPNSEPQVSEDSNSKQGDEPTLVAVPAS